MSRSHVQLVGVVCMALLASASCGARTALVDVRVVDAGPDSSVPCSPGQFPLQKAAPAVMFVLDSSGSMAEVFSLDGSTRWQVLTESLANALPSVDSSMAIGAVVFPSDRSQTTCSIGSTPDLSPSLGNVNALVNLMESIIPLGGTPTADAIDLGAKSLLSVRAAKSARAIILATDGGPNCNTALDPATCTCADPAETQCGRDPELCLDDARTVGRVGSYASQGLPTYVIGIHDPGSTQNDDVLNAMAEAGGRPQSGTEHYYAATSQKDLEGALVAIRNQIGTCTYLTSSVPNASGTITVTVGNQTIPYDPSGKNGWTWGDEGNGEIIFAGAACGEVISPDGGTVSANVTCSLPDAGDAAADGP